MFNLKKLLNDNNLVRDIKTVVSFLLAYAIAVISNGLIEDFSPAALVSIAVTLGAFGTFFAIRIITNEFTERGMFDEEESNEPLQELLKKQRTLSSQIKSATAYDVLLQYNKDQREFLKKEKYHDIKNKLELEVKRLETVIEHTKMTRQFKWFNRFNKLVLSRLERRKNKVTKKLANLSMNDLLVKYTPVELSQLKTANVHSEEDKYSEGRRFSITPQSKVRRQMAATNFAKTFLIVGFQGAAIAQITSWTQFTIFLVLMTLTLATTAFSSYVGTRRYANMNYIGILEEKVEKIEWLNKEVEVLETKKKTETLHDPSNDTAKRVPYEQRLNEFYQI